MILLNDFIMDAVCQNKFIFTVYFEWQYDSYNIRDDKRHHVKAKTQPIYLEM